MWGMHLRGCKKRRELANDVVGEGEAWKEEEGRAEERRREWEEVGEEEKTVLRGPAP